MSANAVIAVSGEFGWSEVRAVVDGLDTVDGSTTVRSVNDLAKARDTVSSPVLVVASQRFCEGGSGGSLKEVLQDAWFRSPFVVLADRFTVASYLRLSDTRISGYFLWSSITAETLGHSLSMIMKEVVSVVSPEVLNELSVTCPGLMQADVPFSLSTREQVVLRLLADGATHAEIALLEKFHRRTVARIVKELSVKLESSSQFTMGKRAAEIGLFNFTSGYQAEINRRM